jgi:hypothetical protein
MLSALQEPAYIAAGFGERGYHNHTTLHPVGLVAVVVLGLATLGVKRRSALIPLLILACFVSPAQRIVVATLDFNLLRVMVLFGFGRVMTRGELKGMRLTRVDGLVLAWAAVSLVAYVGLRGTFGAFIYQAGVTFDVVGLYFLVRCWVRDWRDVDRISWTLSWLALISFVFFAIENRTGRNLFSFLGGANPITIMREGRLRCQGPFVHPILAGSFWAVALPLVACRWWRPRGKPLAVSASLAIIGIVFFSASSTPLLVIAAVVLGAGLYKLRRSARIIRWSVFAGVILLHVSMEKPVWHLITRISVVGGSTGYHRYRLIDAAVNRFPEWALMGTKSTAHWGFYLFDVTNQYVKEAVRAGFLGLVLFLAFIGYSFAHVGRLWRAVRGQRYPTAMAWALGTSLFAHICMFNAVSISHSQQNLLMWFLVIGTLTSLGNRRTGVVRRMRLQLRPVPMPTARRRRRRGPRRRRTGGRLAPA